MALPLITLPLAPSLFCCAAGWFAVGEYEFLHFPAEAVHVDPVRMGRLPESCRSVFEAVRQLGPLTHTDLRERTGMPPRTIRFAIARLKEEGFLDVRCSLRDCRTCYFFVNKRCVGVEALEDARRRAEGSRRLVEQV
jgi:DNA-binding transcriptional ArsR family regulator